jgi:hypothetical protein
MRLRAAFSVVVLLQSCSTERSTVQEEGFRLCSDNPQAATRIQLDFQRLLGIYEDVQQPISLCDESQADCINFPIVFSRPPHLPGGEEEIRWTRGRYQFSIRALKRPLRTYRLHVTGIRHGPDGQHIPYSTAQYEYDVARGILNYRVTGAPNGWIQCGGRLTFDILQAVAARVASR